MEKLNTQLLNEVKQALNKAAFIPMAQQQQPPMGPPPPPDVSAAAGSPMPPAQPPTPQQPQGGFPPEILQMLQDPQVQQLLQQAGLAFDPQSQMLIDLQTQQPIPPEQAMLILQQLFAPPEQGGPAMAPGSQGEPAPLPPEQSAAQEAGIGQRGAPGLPPELAKQIAAQTQKAMTEAFKQGFAAGGGNQRVSSSLQQIHSQLADIQSAIERLADMLAGLNSSNSA